MPETIGSRAVHKTQKFKKAPKTKEIYTRDNNKSLQKNITYYVPLNGSGFFTFWPTAVTANDHKGGENHFKRYEGGKYKSDSNDHKRRRLKNEDEGNELTGLTTAWLLAAANLTVFLSILLKGANRHFPLKPETKNAIKRFSQFQKKHLMRFHFSLKTPLALCIALLHFLLSCCRKTALPEWGLLFVTMMVFLGLMVKFKGAPKWMRKFLYRLHTSKIAFSALILILIIGHLMVE